MKTVKEICLGVAVAGVVAGAGSAVGCAVASADAGDGSSAPDTSASGTENSSAAGPKARGGKRTAATNSTKGSTEASTKGSTEASTKGSTEASTKASQSDTSDGAGNRVSRAGAAVRASAAERVAAPAALTPLSAPLPAPAPFVPVAPASAVTVNASATTSRGRTASQIVEPNHVLLIGVDGVNMSKILEYAYDDPASGFRIVMDQGITGTTSLVGHTTISGPSWSTILTGAWDNKTGVINNIFNPAPYDSWPTVFNLIEYYTPAVETAVIADWQYINDIGQAGGYPADTSIFISSELTWEANDDVVTQRTIELINDTAASDSAFIFSYQVAVDEAGHVAGGDSPEYEAAVINTSKNIALLMAAVNAWEAANPGEEWTVIVTTDHGHQPQAGFGHGFQSPPETSSFVIFDLEGDGANDGKQNLSYTNPDITPTIVSLFGIEQRSDFDGEPLQNKTAGIVTPANLKSAISDAIGLYGYPDVATNLTLGVRTVAGAIPYFLNGFVESIAGFFEVIVGQDIFVISALAGVAEVAVEIVGGAMVAVTQAIATLVGTLTGAGVIPPTDPPLPPPTSASLSPASGIPASVLV